MTGRGLISSLLKGLSKTRHGFTDRLDSLISGAHGLDDGLRDEIEELLVTADIGVVLTARILDDLSAWAAKNDVNPAEGTLRIKESLLSILEESEGAISAVDAPPTVVLVLGVNGTGKTTTIAKIAHDLTEQGKSVILAAGDTFRDAAVEQLTVWGDRLGVEVVSQKQGADPAAVAFDALVRAQARGIDYLFVDTAGRLHTKYNLMEELKKIKRVLGDRMPAAPHETLLVLDAGIGQNNIAQAKKFHEEIGITGIVLTKLDGSAKGGAIFPLFADLRIPIKYIGVGEGADDLMPFDRRQFVEALFSQDGAAIRSNQ
jgi:fused signal recognition particle receptor